MLDCFENKDDSNNLMKFPDRRGWEKVSNIIKNEKTLDDYLDELNRLTGMANVKKHIIDQLSS